MSHHVCISDAGKIIRYNGNLCNQRATGHTVSGVPELSVEQASKAEAKANRKFQLIPEAKAEL